MPGSTPQPGCTPAAAPRWPAARATAAAQEALLRRLCRVTTSYRGGERVQRYEVREPTPENLATVVRLLRKTYPTCQQTSGIAFVAA